MAEKAPLVRLGLVWGRPELLFIVGELLLTVGELAPMARGVGDLCSTPGLVSVVETDGGMEGLEA